MDNISTWPMDLPHLMLQMGVDLMARIKAR